MWRSQSLLHKIYRAASEMNECVICQEFKLDAVKRVRCCAGDYICDECYITLKETDGKCTKCRQPLGISISLDKIHDDLNIRVSSLYRRSFHEDFPHVKIYQHGLYTFFMTQKEVSNVSPEHKTTVLADFFHIINDDKMYVTALDVYQKLGTGKGYRIDVVETWNSESGIGLLELHITKSVSGLQKTHVFRDENGNTIDEGNFSVIQSSGMKTSPARVKSEKEEVEGVVRQSKTAKRSDNAAPRTLF